MPTTLGLDIGGANVKAAHSTGAARSIAFPLWKNPELLTAKLQRLCAAMPAHDILAVTMTGELCDCFASKREGVQAILRSVQTMAGATPIRVWSTFQRFLDFDEAMEDPLRVAAGNWLALARYVAGEFPSEQVLLIDAGSTTTDIGYLNRGVPELRGLTDLERMASGELVYTGVRRTPVCAVLGLEVAAEFFATMLDAYILMDLVPENPGDYDTADGRPATRQNSHARMARMRCADGESFSMEQARKLASYALLTQWNTVAWAIGRVLQDRPDVQRIVLAGSGEVLGHHLCERRPHLAGIPRTSLSELLGPSRSIAACAYALAVLAAKESGVRGQESEVRSQESGCTSQESWVIVKVGGSLYDLPDLRERLTAWIVRLGDSRVLLVPGGGATAESIRAFDRVHQLGEEASHWLAIRALSVNAHFLHEMFPSARLITELVEIEQTSSPWNILDAYPFFLADERRSDHLPHHWDVTSDSLAVRVAELLNARELFLLKSVDWPGTDWSEATRANLVDDYFTEAVRTSPAALKIRVVNLRAWSNSAKS